MNRQEKTYVLGNNQQIKKITETIQRIASFDASVLLSGESGVGKSLFASMIHNCSQRREKTLVVINCGAIPENLLESELFGYEKGAFTGANQKGKEGLIEIADQGTLFLDEIGDLPLPMQVKLLKVIQEKKVMRVGGISEKSIDFRLVAASNKDLSNLVEQGLFRKDLYYRLSVITIDIPPLRKRREDIPIFISTFADKFNDKYHKNYIFSQVALKRMIDYAWPGNVRELENVVEGILLTAEDDVISEKMLPDVIIKSSAFGRYDAEGKSLKEILESVEKGILKEAYEIYGTTTKTARALGISQASVSLKLSKYGIGK